MTDEGLRFADILTTASAIANYLAVPDVTASHLLDAMAILEGKKTLEDLGRPISPLVRRGGPQGAGVEPRALALVQRWFADLGSRADVELTGEQAEALRSDLRALVNDERA
jgi:hypothetical protein